MKRFFILFLVMVTMMPVSLAETSSKEAVIKMSCIVKMPDVIREGLYTGEVQNGVPHGYGVFVTKNSSGVEWHYLGQWENGVMCGQGGQYWDIGQCYVGTFVNNEMLSGIMRKNASFNGWVDYADVVDGCYKAVEYRTDGTILFDGYIDAETNKYKRGTFYTKEGDVFFSGEMGEGFSLNMMYIK